MQRIKSLFFKYVKNSIFVTLLSSYILFMLLPIFLGSITYSKIFKMLEEETIQVDKAMINQVRQFMDEQFKVVNDLSMQISMNPTVIDFMSAGPVLDAKEINKLMKISKEMAVVSNIKNSMLVDFYIYYRNSDLIINKDSKYSTTMFYNSINRYENYTYDQWVENFLNGKLRKKYIPVRTQDGMDTIVYTQSIPISYYDKTPKALLLLHLNENYIREMLLSVVGIENREVYVVDENNQLILTTAEGGIESSKAKIENILTTIEEGQTSAEYIFTIENSRVNEWKYVVVTLENVIMSKTKYIKYFTIVLTTMCLVFGSTLAYLLARKNYKPVKNILKLINKELDREDKSEVNEFDRITKAFHSILEDKNSMRSTLEHQIPILKNSFFHKAFEGMYTKAEMEETSQILNINFPYQYYVAIIFEMDSPLNTKIISNNIYIYLYENLTSKDYMGYVIDDGESMFTLILNFKSDNEVERRKKLEHLIHDVKVFAEKTEILGLTVGIGTFKNSISDIASTYREARSAIEYKLIMGVGEIIWFDEIKSEGLSNYYYPLEVEIRLVNNVKAGEIDKASKIINDIIAENIENRKLSLELARCLFTDIICTIIKIMDELKINSEDSNNNYVEQLLKCKTIIEMQNITTDIFSVVEKSFNQYKKKQTNKLLEKTKELIQKEYMDENLLLASIAEKLGVNRSYLSRYFKEKENMTLVDYLIICRLNKAKELLETTNKTINEISKQVGYNNVEALVRAFKKYEGVTPGKYKLQPGLQQNDSPIEK